MLLALSAMPRPTVHIRSETDELTRDSLLVRLDQEGFAVTGDPRAAELELELRDTAESWAVSARGLDERTYEVPHGEPAVERLELVHRAVAALEETSVRTGAIPPAPNVCFAIAFEAAVDPAEREILRAKTAWQIAEAGGTAVADEAEGGRTLCVGRRDEAVVLSLADANGQCSSEVEATTLDTAQPWLRAKMLPPEEPVITPTPPPPVPTSPPSPATKSEPRRRTSIVRIGARAGVVARPDIDPVFAADVRVGRDQGPQLWIEVQTWFSGAPEIDLQVVELLPGIGARWRLAPHRLLAVDFGVQAQLLAHRYTARHDSGVRFDASGEASAALAIRIVRGLELELDVRGGVASRPRSHRTEDQTVWERSQLRVCTMAGLAWRFDLAATSRRSP